MARDVAARFWPEGPAGRLLRLAETCEADGRSVFCFGSEARIVYALRDELLVRFPRLRLAGICDADCEGTVSRAVVDFIASTHPDVIVVDLDARRSRAFVAAHAKRFPQARIVALEGAFGAWVGADRRRVWRPRHGSRWAAALAGLVRQGAGAARFAGIIAAQILQGGRGRARSVRSPVALRRD